MKNMFKLKTSIAIISLLAVIATGCLKDKYADQQLAGTAINESQRIVEFLGPLPEQAVNLSFKNADTTANVAVINLTGPVLDHDIQVTLKVDDAYLTSYNAAHAADPNYAGPIYNLMPAAAYKVKSLVITIPKGQREGILSITTNPSVVANQLYAVAFTIVSVSEPGVIISGNHATAIVPVGVKNKYDGTYRLDGKFYHPTQSPGYDPFTITVEMHTTGTNSVKLYVPDFGGYYGPGLFGGALNAFGAQEPEFTIDPVTNKVTVQNAFVGAVTFYTMAPGFNSHYEPGPPQKIIAKWGYNYSPGPTFNPAANREWEYVLTYLGPR